ncbi:MAG: amino acid permease [Euryarchaeota archaeon]|nr:amino acid permease [Euryarchaeota archaeon]
MKQFEENRLAEKTVGLWLLVGQGISGIAPLVAMTSVLTASAIYAGGSVTLSYILGLMVVFLIVNTIYQYSIRTASAGGYYTFISKSLGPRMGFVTGWIYIIYGLGVLLNEPIFYGLMVQLSIPYFFGIKLPSYTWLIIVIAFLLVELMITIRGIKISLRYTLISSLIELSLILLFSIVVIVEAGQSNSYLPFTPSLSPTGWQGVFYGLFFSMLAFAGYDTTVNIAEEAKVPEKTIGRAVIIQVLLTGFVFIIMAYATTIGWGMYNMDTFATSITNGISIPGVLLVYKYLGIVAVITMLVLVGNSTISSSTSFLNAVGRNLFALGREVLPKSLARVSRKYKTPYISLSIMSISSVFIIVISAFAMNAINDVSQTLNLFLIAATIATLGTITMQILINFALPFYSRNFTKKSIIFHIVLPITAFAFLLGALYASVWPPSFPVEFAPIIFITWALIGVIMVLIIGRDKKKLFRIGSIRMDF